MTVGAIRASNEPVGLSGTFVPTRGISPVIGLTEIRTIAMALPEVEEGGPVPAARRIAAFKVAGKSFVGIEQGGKSITVSLSQTEAKPFMTKNRKAYEEIWRNKEAFMGLRAHLSEVSLDQVRDLIQASWRHNAPAQKPKR